jgi:preprotein translocase subunit YajC
MPPGVDLNLLLIGGVVVLFYFVLIRPQQKRAKQQKDKMDSLKEGDRVMTISGIVGTIRYLGEKQIILEISPGVEMTVVKGAVSSQPFEDEFEYAGDSTVEPDAEPEVESATVDDAAPSEPETSEPASEDSGTTK